MKSVTIVQHRLLHYRTELFEKIKEKLNREGVTLNLVHGNASVTESKRKDEAKISWATPIKNKFWTIKGVDIIWQKLPNDINDCDLLILMQENRILSNYINILYRRITGKKVAYWGHGKNLQSTNPNGLKEKWKKAWLNSVDYWFAYTVSTVKYLTSQNYPDERIVCLNNAVDVNKFKCELANITDEQITNKMAELAIPIGSDVGVFCGSLYKEKRLELLLDAIDLIKDEKPKFYVVVIGDGPSANFLHKAAESRPWLKMVGVQKGVDKAIFYRFSSLMLNPGLVGLHILDSFCAGLPMITTNDALHSPEYDYLKNNHNGLVTDGNAKAYASAIINLLNKRDSLLSMKSAALADSENYTVENMAENFTQGILKALELEAK